MYIFEVFDIFSNIFSTLAKIAMLDMSVLKIAYCDLVILREFHPFHFQSSFVLSILYLLSSS